MKTNLLRYLKITLIATGVSFSALSASAAPAKTVRHVSTDLDTNNICVPESFEVDVHKMMTNWYLTHYAILDKDADKRKTVVATDQDYIDRLRRLPTVIEMPFNPVVRSFIKMYVERKKGLVETMLGMSLYYMPIFEQALDKYGLPIELKNLAVIESALNPNAVSKAGATGLWQFMASTGQGEGLEINSLVDERRDPYRSSEAAARLLKKLYDTYGDWSLAIAAYNCGPGNVNKALRRAGGGKRDFWDIYRYLPSETRDYIPAFIAANYAMTYYKDHKISPVLAAKPIIVDSVHVNRRVHFQQISDVLGIPVDELRALNPQYRTDLIPGDIKPYPLVLPSFQVYSYLANEDSIVNHNAEQYAHRDVVLPATGTKGDNNSIVDQTVVKYHKVKKGDTMESIAEKYGVATTEIQRANGGDKDLKRGRTLKIYINNQSCQGTNPNANNIAENQTSPNGTTAAVANVAQTDSTMADTRTVSATMPVKQPVAAPVQPSAQSRQVSSAMKKSNDKKKNNKKAPAPVKHTVKSGENLSKIAAKHGVSVDELKKANGLKSDKIAPGQNLTVPTKGSAKSSGNNSSSKGSSSKKSKKAKKRK